MKFLLIAVTVLFTPAAFSQEVYEINANKLCADVVGIPYGSDNFSDKEWEKFKFCMKNLKRYRVK